MKSAIQTIRIATGFFTIQGRNLLRHGFEDKRIFLLVGFDENSAERLSNIIPIFNDMFGNIGWTDEDRMRQLITEEIPARVAADAAFQNARRNSDKQNARIEHDKALARVMTSVLNDDTELFKQFSDNPDFKRWLTDTVFALAYE